MKNKTLLFLPLTALFLFSCPAPLEMTDISQLKDLNAPDISVLSPLFGSDFESSLQVTGTIIDLDDKGNARISAASDYIESACWYLLNQDDSQTDLTVGTDGSFSFSMGTSSYRDQITLVIQAQDLNGNQAEYSVSFDPDTKGPNLVITSPGDYDEYATLVNLTGYVTNSLEDETFSEVKKEIRYGISGTSIMGALELSEEDSSFSTVLNLANVERSRVLTVTAEDLNGNSTSLVLNLIKPLIGGDISGFSVTPGNQQVYLQWDAVDYAQSYSIFESFTGEIVSGLSFTDDELPSYSWTGLDNGYLYSFQLRADIPEDLGADALSAERSTIPLSTRTLIPWVKEEGYKSITLEWMEIAATNRYIIERTTTPEVEASWTMRSKLTGHEFRDNNVEPQQVYYYRVYPVGYSDIVSEETGTMAGSFGYNILGNVLVDDAWNVEIIGDYAYIACRTKGLAIVNISDPRNPGDPFYVDIEDFYSVQGVSIAGDYAYVACSEEWSDTLYGGLAIVDISDPEAPEVVATQLTSNASGNNAGGAYDILVDGSYAYLADVDGLAVIDISDPRNPGSPFFFSHSAGSIVNYCPVGLDFTGSFMVVSSEDDQNLGGKLSVFNMTDRANPLLVSEENLSGIPRRGVSVQGSNVYIPCSDGIEYLSIADPADPSVPDIISANNPYAVMASGDYAFIADPSAGFSYSNISDPDSPGMVHTLDLGVSVYDLDISDNYLYLVNQTSGLVVVDITFPEQTGIKYSLSYSGIMGLSCSANKAFLANRGGGLAVVDLSSPMIPTSLSYVETGLREMFLTQAGDWVFLRNQDSQANPVSTENEIAVVDINQSAPIFKIPLETAAFGLEVIGDYGIFAEADKGFAVIDITNPFQLKMPLYRTLDYWVYSLDLSSDYAFMGLKDGRVAMVNISDPLNPGDPDYLDLTAYTGSNELRAVKVSGRYLYAISSQTTVLVVIDLKNPSSPVIAGSLNLGNVRYVSDIEVSGNYVYIAASSWDYIIPLSGADAIITVINCMDPTNPYEEFTVQTSGNSYDVDVNGSVAYVADGSAGLTAISLK